MDESSLLSIINQMSRFQDSHSSNLGKSVCLVYGKIKTNCFSLFDKKCNLKFMGKLYTVPQDYNVFSKNQGRVSIFFTQLSFLLPCFVVGVMLLDSAVWLVALNDFCFVDVCCCSVIGYVEHPFKMTCVF